MPTLHFPDPPLADEQVLLRPQQRSDESQVFAGFSDPLCQRFSWPLLEPFTEAHVRAQLDHNEQGRLQGTEISLVIADPAATENVMGATSLYEVDTE